MALALLVISRRAAACAVSSRCLALHDSSRVASDVLASSRTLSLTSKQALSADTSLVMSACSLARRFFPSRLSATVALALLVISRRAAACAVSFRCLALHDSSRVATSLRSWVREAVLSAAHLFATASTAACSFSRRWKPSLDDRTGTRACVTSSAISLPCCSHKRRVSKACLSKVRAVFSSWKALALLGVQP